MKILIIPCLLLISMITYASDHPFNFQSLEKAIKLVTESNEYAIQGKPAKSERFINEASIILDNIFTNNRVISAEFTRSIHCTNCFSFKMLENNRFVKNNNSNSDTEYNTSSIENNYIDILKFNVYYKGQAVLNSMITQNDKLEVLQDCVNFKATIKIGKILNWAGVKPYQISGPQILVDCKILSIEPIIVKKEKGTTLPDVEINK